MEEVLKEIGKLNSKIDSVEERFTHKIIQVENKVDTVEKNLIEVEQRLDKKIDVVEQRLENRINQEIQFLKVDLNQKYDDLRESIFYLENSLGGKLDTICDFIRLQMDKNNEKSQNFSQFDKKRVYILF